MTFLRNYLTKHLSSSIGFSLPLFLLLSSLLFLLLPFSKAQAEDINWAREDGATVEWYDYNSSSWTSSHPLCGCVADGDKSECIHMHVSCMTACGVGFMVRVKFPQAVSDVNKIIIHKFYAGASFFQAEAGANAQIVIFHPDGTHETICTQTGSCPGGNWTAEKVTVNGYWSNVSAIGAAALAAGGCQLQVCNREVRLAELEAYGPPNGCTPDCECGNWGACVSHSQLKDCWDNNNCPGNNCPDQTQSCNSSPGKPAVSGPSSGKINQSYSFSAKANDLDVPNPDKVQYRFDWGDGSISGWTPLVGSGVSQSMSHPYSNTGTYQIKAQAQDQFGAQSEWTQFPIFIGPPPCSLSLPPP